MWYFIIGAVIIWVLYRYKKKRQKSPSISVSMSVDNSSWEETKYQKAQSLKNLKKSFTRPQSKKEAIEKAQQATADFIINHGQVPDETVANFQRTELPNDLKKQEIALRKNLNKNYKNREKPESKSLAIYIAFQHAKLLLNNPDIEWKNFSGLQKIQSNWRAEEYFDALLSLMHAFQEEFSHSSISEKLSKDIDRSFELWNARNIAKESYDQNLIAVTKADSASDKHFIILGIITYLERRYKFNPQYRNELVEWCEKDIDLYEQFLIEFHEHQLFTIDEQMKLLNNPLLKQKKLSEISFEKVKRLKDYIVPQLSSYDVLEGIYRQESNTEKLSWLRGIGQRIGYIERGKSKQEAPQTLETLNISTITKTIEVSKSGQQGKLAFLNSAGEACSTEDAFKDYMEYSGWEVMRAEVSFWQAMFCLSFWEEIFDGMGNPVQGQDIPHDLFQGEAFYLNRQEKIDLKFENLTQQDLQEFTNKQIQKAKGSWTRLVYNGDQDMISYFQTPIVQSFLDRISLEVFVKIVYRIARNPNENRSGVSDFVVWNDQELIMVEVKKVQEQVRESQKAWLSWMIQENIPIEIVHVKGV